MDLGLSRVHALLRRVGSPHTKFPVIHIAGTNGKGSTSAYIDSLLTHGVGLRSGRFNSPHLIMARDSARILGGMPIDPHTWERAGQQTIQADTYSGPSDTETPIHATPFELLTVQTLLAFTLLPPESRPEVLVIEVGVGGRLDATNVFPDENVLASVICPIGLDHEWLLGKGIAAIAREKAGILKNNGLCVIADQRCAKFISGKGIKVLPAEVPLVVSLQQACNLRHSRVTSALIPWDAMITGVSPAGADAARLRAPVSFTLPLHGIGTSTDASDAKVEGHVEVEVEATHARLTGSTTALQTLWSIAHDTTEVDNPEAAERQALRDVIRTRLFNGDSACAERIRESLARYIWEGRSEWKVLGTHIPLLLDGAHNEASAVALRHYLERCLDTYATTTPNVSVHITWIMAFSEGKDETSMLHALLCNWPTSGAWRCASQRVAFVPFSTPVEGMPWIRPIPPRTMQAAVQRPQVLLPPENVHTFSNLRTALAWAATSPSDAFHLVVVCGSLYLTSDYYRNSCEA